MAREWHWKGRPLSQLSRDELEKAVIRLLEDRREKAEREKPQNDLMDMIAKAQRSIYPGRER